MVDMKLYSLEKRLNEDKYNNNNDRQKDINDILRMKQEYIDYMRRELYKEEFEKYRFLHKYTGYSMDNELKNKKKILEENDWGFVFNKYNDIELMVETRHNKFLYGLFDRIGRVFLENGMEGLGNYDDIRERTIIDNLLLLNDSLNTLVGDIKLNLIEVVNED